MFLSFLLELLPRIICNAQTREVRRASGSICIAIAAALRKVTAQQGSHFSVPGALLPEPRFFGDMGEADNLVCHLVRLLKNPSLTPPSLVLGTRKRHWPVGSMSPNLIVGSPPCPAGPQGQVTGVPHLRREHISPEISGSSAQHNSCQATPSLCWAEAGPSTVPWRELPVCPAGGGGDE